MLLFFLLRENRGERTNTTFPCLEMESAPTLLRDTLFSRTKSVGDVQEQAKLLCSSDSLDENESEGNSFQQPSKKNGCISSLRDVQKFFFILMVTGLLFFSVVPIVSLLSLNSLYTQIHEGLQAQALEFINYYKLMLDVDELSITLFYSTYFHDTALYNKILALSESAATATLAFLAKYCSSIEGCIDAVSTNLNYSYSAFVETSLPSFYSEVESRLSTLETYVTASSLRNTLVNKLVSPKGQATFSRASYLVANAKLSCFAIDSCWTNADAQTFFSSAEEIIGQMVGSLAFAINDIFSTIEDPRLGQTTAAEMIAANKERNTKRTALIESASAYFTQAATLFDKVQSASSVPTELTSLYFVLPPNWSSTILAALQKAGDFVVELNSIFLDSFGITSSSPTGVETALNSNSSQAEVLSLAQSLKSYFAYDIGTGLSMSIPEDEATEIDQAFQNTLISYCNSLEEQINNLYVPVISAFATLLYDEDMNGEHAAILKMVLPTLIICALICFGVYLSALILVRYHLPASPLSFQCLLSIIGVLFVFQLGMSILVVVKVSLTPFQRREFTLDYMLSLNQRAKAIGKTGSMITRSVVESALLIAPNYSSAEEFVTYISTNIGSLFSLFSGQEVQSEMLHLLEIYQSLIMAGFYPLRQGFTAASSLGFTSAALAKEFGIATLDNETGNTSDACELLTGASLMVQLGSVYYCVSAIREQLASGSTTLNYDLLTGEFSSATTRISCLLSYILQEANGDECYNPAACTNPSSYGLLRGLTTSASMYSLFDPFSTSNLGTLFTTVNSLRTSLYGSLENVYSDALSARENDSQIIETNQRFVLWFSFCTFLVAFCVNLVLFLLLFGNSFFSIFA